MTSPLRIAAFGDLPRYPWMETESFIAELTFPPERSVPDIAIRPIVLDANGVPHRDPTNRAVELLRVRSTGIKLEAPPHGSFTVSPV